ncbi:MAG: hypothetical protein CME59_08635 [Halioglobus sp.]|nr:hypothetical protein [Halioglobus sp.]
MLRERGALDEALAARFEAGWAVMEDHFRVQFHHLRQELKEAYAPFDPDADTRPAPVSPSPPPAELSALLQRVLERGNYEKVTEQDLQRALRASSLFQVRLYVDLEDFEEVLLYTRGESLREETLREFFGLWRRRVRFINYERVLLYIRLRQDIDADSTLGECPPGSTLLRLFQNVPQADLEMLFPNIRVGMRLLDKLMIGVPAVVSGGIVLSTKLGATLLLLGSLLGFWLGVSSEPVQLDRAALLALGAGLGALGGYLWKQFANFRNRKLKYTQALTENLYFKLLDNNAGVLFRLLDDAEDSECKESLLAWHFLLAHGEPMSAAELDAAVEQWFASRWQCRLDFDVADALGKLQRLGLARCDGERYAPTAGSAGGA